MAKKISEGLARVTLAGLVNGEVQDLRHKLTEDCKLEILTFDSLEGKKAYWHTTSHIMAQAIKRLYGDSAKLTIGPSIDNGFYYDFDVEKPFTEEDLAKIEEEMKKIWRRFYKLDASRNRENGGTGIGLSLVKAIMSNYNNKYGVQNRVDGVEFYFELKMEDEYGDGAKN